MQSARPFGVPEGFFFFYYDFSGRSGIIGSIPLIEPEAGEGFI